MGEKNFRDANLSCPKVMNIQTLTEESRLRKLEFVNLYCEYCKYPATLTEKRAMKKEERKKKIL